MKKFIVALAFLLTATNAFAMSEQARGAIFAAQDAYMYMVLNKHCKYVPQAVVKKHADFIIGFADEFIKKYPNAGFKRMREFDAYLKDAPKAERNKICNQNKTEVMNWVENQEGEGDEADF